MKDLQESQSVRDTYLQIDLAYLEIEKAKFIYEEIFKNRSDFDQMLDKSTGFHQKKAKQLATIMILYLTQIIAHKKAIDADTWSDQKTVDGLNKMLEID